jgi:hypothetical protein
MEASTAGGAVAPAAADGDGQVQAPQGAPAPDALGQPAPEQGDVQAQLAELQKRAESAESQLQQFQEQGPSDLLSALDGGEEEAGFTPEEIAALQAGEDPNQQNPQEAQDQMAELEAYFKDVARQQAQEVAQPIIEQRRTEQISAWQKDHPDLTPGSELFKDVVATMQNLADQFGEEAAYDLNLLNLAYTGAKAKLADAGAVPAEQAGAHGATLETGAGTVQTDGDSEADQYRKALTGVADNPLA